VFFDGTDMDYVDMPEVGASLDLHQIGTSTYPPWMAACSVLPYLYKDGSVYSASNYTALAQLLGSTFGGNGVTTFGVPDERGRSRIPVDLVNGRLTPGGSGVNGAVIGSVGGSEFTQQHNHVTIVTDPGHFHQYLLSFSKNQTVSPGGALANSDRIASNTDATTTGITVSTVNFGAGGSQNVQPSIISCFSYIKT
jgi:microcystin-dependent protein